MRVLIFLYFTLIIVETTLIIFEAGTGVLEKWLEKFN